MSPEVRVTVDVQPALAVRRPPLPLLELLDKPEQEFRRYVEEIEQSDLFNRLMEAGVVRKVRTGGRVPKDRYQEYMDVQLMQFLNQCRVTEYDDWEADFSDPASRHRLAELAEKYHADPAKLDRMLEYYQRIMRDDADHFEFVGYESQLEEEPEDYVDLVPSPNDVDLSHAIELAQVFVERHNLSREAFVRDFLAGEPNAVVLAERYRAPLLEVVRLLEALNSMQIAQGVLVGGGVAEADAHMHSEESGKADPIAVVRLEKGQQLALEFPETGIYAKRYATRPEALKRLQGLPNREEAEHLLLELQWINQRKSTLCRLVKFVCDFQFRFLLTGDPYLLKPLSQAEVARQLGEDEATICRMIRDKLLQTPYGTVDLKYLLQRKTAVIRRIVTRHPQYTDEEVRRILKRDYHCDISRRTVAYHRQKGMGNKVQRRAGRLPEAARQGA